MYDIYPFLNSFRCSFLLGSQGFFFYYLFSVQRASFSHSLRVSVPLKNSLKFPSSENILISLHF